MPIPIGLPEVTDATLKSFQGAASNEVQVVGITPYNLIPLTATQANSQISVSSSALLLDTYRPPNASHAEIFVETNPIRWWDDGKTPTNTQGKLLPAGQSLNIETPSTFRFIATTGTATITISWYKMDES